MLGRLKLPEFSSMCQPRKGAYRIMNFDVTLGRTAPGGSDVGNSLVFLKERASGLAASVQNYRSVGASQRKTRLRRATAAQFRVTRTSRCPWHQSRTRYMAVEAARS